MLRLSIRKRVAGFTLIELLVALFIFAVLSGLSYRSLSTLLDTKETIETENQRWREILLFFNRLELDTRQRVSRSVKLDNQVIPAWSAHPSWSGDHDAQLRFCRLGNAYLTGHLGDTQRIGYRLNNHTVELLIWPALDVDSSRRPAVYPVLHHVKHIAFRYLSHNKGGWSERWPLQASDFNVIPKAMEVQITLENGHQLSRMYTLQ